MPNFGAEYNAILNNLATLYDLRQEKIEVVKINKRINQVSAVIRHPLVQDSTGVIHSLNTAGTYIPVSVLPLAELPNAAHYQNGAIVSAAGGLYVKKNGAWEEVGRSYKVYTALLSQSGTDAPSAVIMENTIGNIVWSRIDTGDYAGILADAFPENKTVILPTTVYQIASPSSIDDIAFRYLRDDTNKITLQSYDNSTGTRSDSVISNSIIEIRVYQ